MHIICSTTSAAAHVLVVLFDAGLRPRSDFRLHPVFSSTPPIVFTLDPALLNGHLPKIRAITDTTIDTTD